MTLRHHLAISKGIATAFIDQECYDIVEEKVLYRPHVICKRRGFPEKEASFADCILFHVPHFLTHISLIVRQVALCGNKCDG